MQDFKNRGRRSTLALADELVVSYGLPKVSCQFMDKKSNKVKIKRLNDMNGE